MRFMESQDEDRIVYFYSGVFQIDALTTFQKTMPLATVLFTAPGFPMLWNGQEVGWGYGITGSKEARARSVIDWSYQGRGILAPHYQKLATLRGTFPAFTEPKRDTTATAGWMPAMPPSSTGSLPPIRWFMDSFDRTTIRTA
jgi:hypothetical protein